MQLSKNFTLEELSKSLTAERRRWDNTPPPYAVENLRLLCTNILQPVRDHFNLPVKINSGYRSANVNRAEGGVFNSSHLTGQAADFEIPGVVNADVWRFISSKVANFSYDQLIAEHLKLTSPTAGWIHVSFAFGANRKQAISCVEGRYVPGLQFER